MASCRKKLAAAQLATAIENQIEAGAVGAVRSGRRMMIAQATHKRTATPSSPL